MFFNTGYFDDKYNYQKPQYFKLKRHDDKLKLVLKMHIHQTNPHNFV